MANIGWGQSTWGTNRWGGQLDVAVVPTGVAATSALGTVTASSIFVIEVTGQVATSAVGSVLAKIPITALLQVSKPPHRLEAGVKMDLDKVIGAV